jgi:hypothetical protein
VGDRFIHDRLPRPVITNWEVRNNFQVSWRHPRSGFGHGAQQAIILPAEVGAAGRRSGAWGRSAGPRTRSGSTLSQAKACSFQTERLEGRDRL